MKKLKVLQKDPPSSKLVIPLIHLIVIKLKSTFLKILQ
jgi:hypothetical protein